MRYTWVGHTRARPVRGYALGFTPRGQMLLVRANPEDPGWCLPGGGVKPGETTQEALKSELREEADAVILAVEELGLQRRDGVQVERAYHRYYWCRIGLGAVWPDTQVPQRRLLILADDFLDTLCWG